MRTLLVDNYDSYTYNLYQLLAEVNDQPPLVIRNDAAEWDELDWPTFDNVVISPGPGHPGRPRDFGRCAELIATTSLPVLGVCLGHQGIGLAAGAQVGPAPAPRHGYLSHIRHDGSSLFAGIPQGFVGVRYHSLCLLAPLPEALTATAWAEDGVIMAVRHRHRPQWGVQFHPESVATEFGHRLLANFRDLTRTGARSRPPLSSTRPLSTPTTPTTPTAPSVQRFAVRSRTIDGAIDTERVFAALYRDSSHAFWLDSSRVDASHSRFSFLGDTNGPHAETLTYRVGDGFVYARSSDGSAHHEPGTIFDVLTARIGRLDFGAHSLPFGLTGGYVGYFGYELKADCGASSKYTSDLPDAVWMFADRLVVVDHV